MQCACLNKPLLHTKGKKMCVSINVFISLHIFLIACSTLNFMYRSQCHKSIFIITLEIICSFRTAIFNHLFTVSLTSLRFLFNPSTRQYCSFTHPSMKVVREGIKRVWTIGPTEYKHVSSSSKNCFIRHFLTFLFLINRKIAMRNLFINRKGRNTT